MRHAGLVSIPSKSAMYVQTSEFRALTTIFLSTGPVISTRLSARPGAGGAPFHASLSRMCFVSGRKSGRTPRSSSACLSTRFCRRALRVWLKVRCKRGEEYSSIFAQDLLGLVVEGTEDIDVLKDSSCVACQSIHCEKRSGMYNRNKKCRYGYKKGADCNGLRERRELYGAAGRVLCSIRSMLPREMVVFHRGTISVLNVMVEAPVGSL